ncbi:MAG: [citrate (pro-3S)-lyase] ligase [Aminobacteriaceae bacterium]
MFGLEERILAGRRDMEERRELLRSRDLAEPGGEDLVLGFFSDGKLVATGALVGNILQGIAVDREIEGEGAAAVVASALVKKAVERGIRRIFIYSKPEEARRFQDLGFTLLASVSVESSGLGASLLEWGSEGINAWKKNTAVIAENKPPMAGSVVVNCNPFTLGHRRLIEYASGNSKWLYIFVVQEDRSLFPFDVRFRLVSEGTADLPNVTVVPGGPYVISSATFPTYFTRIQAGDNSGKIIELYAALDLEMFRKHVVPILNIGTRFVGTEPYCPVTSVYNEMMKRILPVPEEDCRAIDVVEIPRFLEEGVPVSASRVRDLIRENMMNEVEKLVPEVTWKWLNSEDAVPVLEKIRKSNSRH